VKAGLEFQLRRFHIIVFVINNLSFVVKSAAILLVMILLVPFLFILHEDLFSFSYRQLGYSIIADKLKENTDSDEEFLVKTVGFINQNIYPVGNLQDKSTWNDLLISQAWCDQVSRDVAEILAVKDIPARIIMDAGESHSVGEAFINNKFRFYDAQNNYIFWNLEGELATFEDVANGRLNLQNHKILADIKSGEDLGYDLKKYSGLVINPNMGKNRWKSYTDIYGPTKEIIINLVRLNYAINPWFDKIYQDLYLVNSEMSSVLIGRNYELFNRPDKALKQYLLSLKDGILKEDGLFYIGRMHVSLGNYNASISHLEELLKQYPKTKWKDPANYILAEAHRLLGNNLSARYYYNKSRKPYYGSANKLFNKDL